MTTDLHTMQAINDRQPADMNDPWASGASTMSLTMDDDDGEMGEHGDGDDAGSSRKYERKTRRFAWPDDLHRLFVAAIFDLGLKNASPKALMPFMEPTATCAGLTTEHLKSHLQKYRQNYDKSRSEFLAFFDESAKKNGRRRRRTAKCMESHTRFIFPIMPHPPSEAAQAGQPAVVDLKIDPATAERAGASPQPSYYACGLLSPRTRLDRANLLRLAQQSATTAFVGQSAAGGYGSDISSQPTHAGSEGVTDTQWGMLASLLSPSDVGDAVGAMPTAFSLNQDAPPDMQLQMHLAMQAQMNLHRQMLNRKVAVSQHYYNQAAAVKRAAASAMVERALQNYASNCQQQEQPIPGRYIDQSGRYHESPLAAPGQPQRHVLNDGAAMQQMMFQQQPQQPQQPHRYITSSQADALLGPPWDPMDIDMPTNSDDQSDLFGFLKSGE